MSQKKSILIYGFAIFAMFFGSGNLVFPLQIGYADGTQWIAGFLGLLITGIILPFLGFFVIKLHQGDYRSFFGEAGKFASLILPLVMLALLGPFGVVPRCITVAHGSLHFLLPGFPLTTFSILFCLATFLICLSDKGMVKLIGKWLSPMLLLSLIVLIVSAVIYSPEPSAGLSPKGAFVNGFRTGYQTMDLFAAFFFSALIFTQIKHSMPENISNRELIRFAIKPSLVAAAILAAVYLGFVYLGAHYSFLLNHTQPEAILPTIAEYTLGNSASVFIGVAILFSCLTTAVALNNLFARFITRVLRLGEKGFYIVLFITTIIAFSISMLDFDGIASFLGPLLELFYPALIALTIMCLLLRNNHHRKLKMIIFYGGVLATLSLSIAQAI